jgi:hypothetical protein
MISSEFLLDGYLWRTFDLQLEGGSYHQDHRQYLLVIQNLNPARMPVQFDWEALSDLELLFTRPLGWKASSGYGPLFIFDHHATTYP